MSSRRPLALFLVFAVSLLLSVGPLGSAPTAHAATLPVVDDFEAALPVNVADGNGIPIGFFIAQDGNSSTSFSRTTTPPAAVPGSAATNNVLKMDFSVVSFGVVIHGFENAAANQWVTQDWSAFGGMSFWLYGNNSGTDLFVDVIDNRNAGSTRDDAERYTVSFKDNFSGWKLIELPFDSFTRKEIGNGAPNDGFTLTEVHGWAFGTLATATPQTYYLDDVTLYGTAPVRPLTVGFAAGSTDVKEGRTGHVIVKLSKPADAPVTVAYATADGLAVAGRDYTPAAGTLTFAPGVTQRSFDVATLDDSKYEIDESVLLRLANPSGAELGLPSIVRLNIQDNDANDPALLDDFETPPYMFTSSDKTTLASKEIGAQSPRALPGQGAHERVLQVDGEGHSPLEFGRRFAQGQDWRGNQGLSFWFYGNHSGRKIAVNLLDNQAPDPGPNGWKLTWRDEFNSRAGTPPDPQTWGYELGDGTANGIPGWGNSELEYYTNKAENAATDGHGNLVITTKQADSSLQCYYGPCQYTSARLLTKNKFEVTYGRIEARIRVPRGAGLWPAFWTLGTNIDQVNWPQSGEIDIMENVGRLPNRVFGTLHGPGYSGGNGFGNTLDLPSPLADAFHTFAIEWQPGEIRWYIDGVQYHRARPSDVAPNQWVYDHPFFMLLNVAVGGNFGGAVGADTTFPQTMAVDYVRIFQAADTAERFQATFTDNFAGWRRVIVPFSAFKRTWSPPGAPNDGLTLSSVNGYGFEIPGNYPEPVLLDQVKIQANCGYSATVKNTNDSGDGSLRQAINDVCFGGAIGFAPSLAGKTIGLTSAELTIAKPLTIDGAQAPGLTISGSDAVRPFVINANTTATIRNLTVAHGFGFELAGGILNNGTLRLDHVIVANNRVTSSGNDFWKGGGGIYNGDGSTLSLVDSIVRDNTTDQVDGGGIYGYFNSVLTIDRSTIMGNSAGNVGGGLRSLGDGLIVNSTLSANNSTAWHGGAIFHTDGVLKIVNSTIADNTSPGGTAGGIFVGTFTAGSPTLTLINSIVARNSSYQCQPGPFGSGTVTATSLGHNLATDPSCFAVASDVIAGDALIGPLADNGGPTPTHALLDGSPAIDAADAAACPATDQRGLRRPQGHGCDIGAFERRR